MKLLLVPLLLSVFLFSYPISNKEAARKDLERCHKKLNSYTEAVRVLTEELIKLQQQWEEAEDKITITMVKELQKYPAKKERERYIHHIMGAREEVEQNIEKTILEINHLTDSISTTQQKIKEVKAVIGEKQLFINQYGKIPNLSDD